MAEVEKMSAAAPMTAAAATDIPIMNNVGGDAGGSVADLGTSPTQERSTSHPHDSEYDTASDLEGGDDYDEDEDDLDDDDDGESITDDDDEEEEDEDENIDGSRQGAVSKDKVESEPQKKVDEDRSNPQYIPKRGTFYEHDDRTAEVEGESAAAADGESYEGSGKTNQTPIISHASKTMKKWQAASGVERWSHDRFEASEQAPKSRSELVNAYGYDIRTEDAPPRARRRRRYGHGPSKYSRNWEDENAYLKASNKVRKPPRSSEFPALNERNAKPRKPIRGVVEEKENRTDKRQVAIASSGNVPEKSHPPQRSVYNDERDRGRERERERDRDRRDHNDGKGNRGKNFGRQSGPVGRQAALEFKQKRNISHQQINTPNNNTPNNRIDTQNDRQPNTRHPNTQPNAIVNESQKSSGKGQQYKHQNAQAHQNDSHNNNNNTTNKVQPHEQAYQQAPHQQQSMPSRQAVPHKTVATSNLAQRLQVQNRNDPSHVGSVQMHSLATQNQQHVGQQQQQSQPPPQQQQQQQQQQVAPTMMVPMQQQVPQEQRGPPKRYSSLRRSQHESQHLAEHQLQQLHLQQQQQQQQPMLLQEQHMLQANLMQLYHQENIQAQMQALQVGPASAPSKQPTYTTVPPPAQPQPQPYGGPPGTAAGPAAYYVAAPDAYAANAAANAQPPQAAQYTQPPQNYLPATQGGPPAPLAYASGPPPAQQGIPGPAATPYGPATVAAVPVSGAATPAGPNPNPNFTNYQNYNTVGGTTYFVPPAPTTARPVVLPQRRPTNAIPILPPAEKNKRIPEAKEEDSKNNSIAPTPTTSNAPLGSAENIDHIIDNMFVQRPAYQPPQAASVAHKTSVPPSGENTNAVTNETNPVSGQQNQPEEIASNSSSTAEKVSNNTTEVSDPVEKNNSGSVTVQE